MTTVGELKIHVTACGIPELTHLLEMLEANIAVLPGVVVKAMQALADSVPDAQKDIAIQPLKIECGPVGDINGLLRDIVSECNRASIAGGAR